MSDGLIQRSYEYMDGKMLKNLLIALIKPHQEFSNIVSSLRLIKDRKLIEGVQQRATKLIPELRNIPYEERLRKDQVV